MMSENCGLIGLENYDIVSHITFLPKRKIFSIAILVEDAAPMHVGVI